MALAAAGTAADCPASTAAAAAAPVKLYIDRVSQPCRALLIFCK